MRSDVVTSPAGHSPAVARASVALVRFSLGEANFGLPALAVREVLQAVAISRLPSAPEAVEGVVNVRGDILPVLDLRRRFGFAAVPLHPDQHFIITRSDDRDVVLRVDAVHDLVEVADSDLSMPDDELAGRARIAGLARLPDGVVVIVDLARFLSLDEAIALDTAMALLPR